MFLKNRFLLLLKSYETQVRFFGMLIDSRLRSSAISALLTIQKVKKKRNFMKFQIVIKIPKLQCIIPKLQKISFSLLLKNAGTAFCNETDDVSLCKQVTLDWSATCVFQVCVNKLRLIGQLQ